MALQPSFSAVIPVRLTAYGNLPVTSPPRELYSSKLLSRMRWNAWPTIPCHLTPRLVAKEINKMPEVKTIIAVHIKAQFREATVRELHELKIPNLVIGNPETDYQL